MRERAATVLPDTNATIVVHCASTECRNSGIAVSELEQLGYTRVPEYVEGKKDWIPAGLPLERIAA